jgi:integrating conjugative element membrane protein (TIGR03747 family)
MVLWWPDGGVDHSRTMLVTEISYLDNDFRRSVVTSDPARFAKRFADNTYHYLFEVTRFVDFIQWVSLPPRKHEQGVRVTLHKVYKPMAEYVLAMMQVTQVFSVRLAILTLAMPVFLLFSLVALVDGLVQRDLRRWGGGRESSFVYHYAKKAALPLFVLTWVTYLALPFSLHPTFVILPFATLFALTVAVTASTFKKYL